VLVGVGVVVGGTQQTSTYTAVVRSSSPVVTSCRTPACNVLMSAQVHATNVVGLSAYAVVESA